ncbi:hypothetical protein [Limnofasciculus baicalensis]|uniref:Uncharacterized protein n=1 Tax=Limnofasciculus baicalensis BBK-W-15 TaxID=2699891 RepID=A0AAE3KQ19_9CYAN|nr:hypothetical protein [Limnofasciculus baicalensis]MCP2730243.1 hypothetical protein [Limnofasciculus baicalensis BBK-W-15]
MSFTIDIALGYLHFLLSVDTYLVIDSTYSLDLNRGKSRSPVPTGVLLHAERYMFIPTDNFTTIRIDFYILPKNEPKPLALDMGI